jgi:hypothetical protein
MIKITITDLVNSNPSRVIFAKGMKGVAALKLAVLISRVYGKVGDTSSETDPTSADSVIVSLDGKPILLIRIEDAETEADLSDFATT